MKLNAHQLLQKGIDAWKEGNFKDAEISFKKTIELKPDLFEAHNNLGVLLQSFDRLEEAIISFKKAIRLKSDYVEAYNNLGNTIKDLDRVDEAEENYRKAIALKLNYTAAYKNLDTIQRENRLLNALQTIKLENKKEIKNNRSTILLTSNPFIANRSVEPDLLTNLYKINSTELSKTIGGPLFGVGRTTDYQLFENDLSILKIVKEDLIKVMEQAVKADIFILESFFNILGAGGGSVSHTHISNFDKIKGLTKKKFSLVYYVSVGDQNCTMPGIFKIENPDEEILPTEGMIMIIPAERKHSAVYSGKIDRVMIGINFYCFS